MSPEAELRLLRRLATPGVQLAPDGTRGWGAYPRGDRRRRALARIADADVRALTEAGALTDGQTRTLTPDGLARLARLRAARERGEDDGFQAQHQDRARRNAPGAGGPPITVNLSESPLARLIQGEADGPGALGVAEIQAGERLRADLARSTYNRRVTMDWSAPPPDGTPRAGHDPAGAADGALAARQRVNAALAAVGAPLDAALLDLLWREMGLEAIERARGWPRRTGRLGLKLGLESLARHYGLTH